VTSEQPEGHGRPGGDEEAIRGLLRSGAVQPLEAQPTTSDLAKREKQQELELKGSYARNLLRAMFVQLGVADAVFITYAWAGESWHLAPAVIEVWLAATVVRVIGVVFVVTRSLFPTRDA
jgi:hypothetical protein